MAIGLVYAALCAIASVTGGFPGLGCALFLCILIQLGRITTILDERLPPNLGAEVFPRENRRVRRPD